MKKIKYLLLIFFISLSIVGQAQVTADSLPSAQNVTSNPVIYPADTAFNSTNDTAKIQSRTTRNRKTEGVKVSSSNKITEVHATDSALRKKHNPTVATCLALIPGAGQIYNKKYWKLPIVYVSLGVSSYFVYHFATQMTSYKNEFIYRRDGITDKLNPEYAYYTDENVLALRSQYRRYMEIAIGVTAILYLLNILDACVDAHLYYFDISDDLSMNVVPKINTDFYNKCGRPTLNYGVGLTLNFK